MLDPGDSPAAARARLAAALGRLAEPPPAPLPPLGLLPVMALARGRAHEVTGAARRVLAAALAGRAQGEGPVLWVRPGWTAEGFCPQGLRAFADPGALVTVACRRAPEILWAAEEALCSGAVALVVAELAAAPDLRQIRRLHRAAAEGVARADGSTARGGGGGGAGNGGAGQGGARRAPLAVLMMQDRAESRIAGVESRWALHPLPQTTPAAPPWRLERLQARADPPGDWPLRAGPRGLQMA